MKIVQDVACPRCACVCDDLTLIVQDNRVVAANGACVLAHDWYLRQNSRRVPVAQTRGQSCDLDSALTQAAALLQSSKNPLIYGLSRSSTAGQRAAVALADYLGATIDTTASEGHAPSLLALQQSGESTCSLGEIRNRADLVIFWGADPETTHPRHLERYSLDPVADHLPEADRQRHLVVIDHRRNRNQTAKRANTSLTLEEGTDFAAIWTLRLLLRGESPAPDCQTTLPLADLVTLAERMKHCRCGVVFFGYGLARQPLGHRVVEGLLKLTIELNEHTRFYARRMRMLGDVSGADNVLCWQTGYPFAVNFARKFPRYSPGEFSAADALSRGEPDVALFVGSDRVPEFSDPARRHLENIPTILLDGHLAEPCWAPTIRLTTATYGIHSPGTAYRMDDIPIPLQKVLDTDYPTDSEVLTALLSALQTTAQPNSG